MKAPPSSSSTICPNASGCRLFPMFKLNALLRVWQVSFCESGHTKCERFKMNSRGEMVPDNMLPNGKLLGGG